jgi:hypothetical protein
MAVGLLAFWTLCLCTELVAQASYKAANSFTSIIPREYGFFSIGFEEARLGLTFVTEPWTTCEYGECSGGGLGFGAHLTAAARKGQEDLFSNFAFNPGFGAGVRVSYTVRQGGASYDVFYLDLKHSTVQQKIAEWGTGDTVLALDERNRRDAIGSVGFNHSFGRGTAVGLRGEVRREFGSVGANVLREVCVPARGGGGMYIVCSHRFFTYSSEPLPNVWAGHARLDYMLRLTTLGSAASAPVLALLGAGSFDKRENANATYNIAIGAAIAPTAYPGQSAVAIVAGLNDATDANGMAPGFNDRFVIGVTVGLSFDMVARTR